MYIEREHECTCPLQKEHHPSPSFHQAQMQDPKLQLSTSLALAPNNALKIYNPKTENTQFAKSIRINEIYYNST